MNNRYSWNPWHGCHRISEGCKNCWCYRIDEAYDKDSGIVKKTKTGFNLPLKKDRQGCYKIPKGAEVATAFTSDFFIEEADEWRTEAWEIIKKRSDVYFLIATKRISRFMDCIPDDWGDGYDNVIICVSIENQKAADLRLPALIAAPIKHRGVFAAPLLERIDFGKYLKSGKLDLISVSGESAPESRICDFEWVDDIRIQCNNYGVPFSFHQTGSRLLYNGKIYKIPYRKEHEQAKKAFDKTK